MNEAPRSGHWLRSVLAVFAGLVAVVVTSTAADALMHGTGVFPPPGTAMSAPLWLLATAYRTAFGVLGGYVAARLARARPVAHALALGWIGVAFSLAGTISTWNMGPEFGPKWYPISLVVIALPSSWAGAMLLPASTRQLGRPR
jgi:surface polysaccharide O-acyltransferase-like enzyme